MYLSVKNAFSVSPEQHVAIAITNVVIPNVECIGTRLARNDAVADSQHKSNKKLKKPTINYNKKENGFNNDVKSEIVNHCFIVNET